MRRFFLLTGMFLLGMPIIAYAANGVGAEATAYPKRIASLNLCTDELLLRLVEPERVVAVTRYAHDGEFSTIAEDAKNIRIIKGHIEEIIDLNPDLVLAGVFTQREAIHLLSRFDVPVLILEVPQNFEDIYKNIRRLAEAVGEIEKGTALISMMQKRLEALRAEKDEKPRVLFLAEAGIMPGNQTFENAIIQAAGAVNLAAELGIEGHGYVSLEHLMIEKPDILVYAGDRENHPAIRREALTHRALQKGLPDAKTVVLPSHLLNCGTPASMQAVEMLAAEIKASGYSGN